MKPWKSVGTDESYGSEIRDIEYYDTSVKHIYHVLKNKATHRHKHKNTLMS